MPGCGGDGMQSKARQNPSGRLRRPPPFDKGGFSAGRDKSLPYGLNRKRDLAAGFGGVRAPRPTHRFLSGVVGRPALWPPWPFAAAGSCGPGMPGPYRAAMGKRDTAVSFGGVRAPRPTHGFSSGVVGRPVLWPPWPFAMAVSARPLQMAGELAAMSVGGEPYSGKTKKTRRPLPRLVFFKRRRKTERLAGA